MERASHGRRALFSAVFSRCSFNFDPRPPADRDQVCFAIVTILAFLLCVGDHTDTAREVSVDDEERNPFLCEEAEALDFGCDRANLLPMS